MSDKLTLSETLFTSIMEHLCDTSLGTHIQHDPTLKALVQAVAQATGELMQAREAAMVNAFANALKYKADKK